MKPPILLVTIVFLLNLSSQLPAAVTPSDALEDPGGRHTQHIKTRVRRAELESRKRAFPLAAIPPGAMARAVAQTQAADSKPRLPSSGSTWYPVGPAPIDSTKDLLAGPISGRVSAVAVDPIDSPHWLIGAAQGGIWSTMDGGGSWTPMTDDQPSLAIGAITFAPSGHLLVYAGTGEANFSGDSYAGQGLLVSRDDGKTWQMINTNFAESSISSIRVDYNNTNNVTVATVRGTAGINASATNLPPLVPTRGVFVSTNGGTNFTLAIAGEATDVAADVLHFQHQYAGLGEILGAPTNGVYRTTNGWASWQRIAGPWTATDPTNIGRIALALAPSDPNTLYVGIAAARTTNSGSPLLDIWHTANAWAPTPTWDQLPYEDNGSFLWYSFALLVDEYDPGTLYYAGYNVLKYSSNNWINVAGGIHPDNHAMAWTPFGFDFDTFRMLLGNDGGVWLSGSYPVNGSWSVMNANLAISQIYKGAVSSTPKDPLALAGMQDNGTAFNPGTLLWTGFFGGDGADVAIASIPGEMHWAFCWETLENEIHILRTTDGGMTTDNGSFGIDPTDAPFFVHFEKAPYDDDLFIGGTVQLWRCTNFFSTITTPFWYSNSPTMFDQTGTPVPISAMAFAPSDTNGLIYAFGTEDGQLRITSSGGASWFDLDPTNGVPQRYITGLAFSPTNANILYVTLSGFNLGTPGQPGHLFKTTNAFASPPRWIDISPPVDLPHNCLVINPIAPNNIFVGTDLGVWTTSDGGSSWSHYGPSSGMPNVAVYDLRTDSIGNPTAFTHGRSAFTLKPPVPIIDIIARLSNPVLPKGCLTCPPVNWVNPGDWEQVQIGLQNVLPINTVNLVATMLSSAAITPINGVQTYGALAGQGAPGMQTFSFRVNAAPGGGGAVCGGTVNVTFDLTDQGADLGQVSIPFRVGVPSFPLGEEFNEVPPGGLPPGWTSAASGADLPWAVTINTPPNEPPANPPDGPDDEPDTNGPPVFSVFTPASSGQGVSFLTTPPFPINGTQAQLYFRQAFLVSNNLDGCTLEISIGSQGFQDILSAGGSFVQAGYNTTLNDRNPLGPRHAWSGDSGGYLPVLVNLPPSAAGQPVQLRWHFATATGLTNGGWFIGAVSITDSQCLPPVSNPAIVNPALHGNQFTFSINTVTNRLYFIQYKTNLNDTAWQTLESLPGNGLPQNVSVPVSGSGQLFYRFQAK